MNISLVNDDGIDSPLLPHILDALAQLACCKNLDFVVPDQERSWISQAITRFSPIEVSKAELHGHSRGTSINSSKVTYSGYSCSGTPADCANLAIDNLSRDLGRAAPDLLVSGINIGTNAGVPYFLYSGTVGAAKAASLRSIPAIALSLQLPFEIFSLWDKQDPECFSQHKQELQNLCSIAAGTVSYLVQNSFIDQADLFSVNIPWSLAKEDLSQNLPKAVFTELQPAKISSVFKEDSSGVFTHNFQGLSEFNYTKFSDLKILEQGLVSVSAISYQSGNPSISGKFQLGDSFTLH